MRASGLVRFSIYRNPCFVRVLGRETVESQGRKKAYNSVRSMRRHFGESVVLADFRIWRCIRTTIYALKLSLLKQSLQHRTVKPSLL